MENLKDKESLILDDFERAYGRKISFDGLHFMGDFYCEDGFWGRYEKDEEKCWKDHCAKKRGLVIITKELNDPENPWDIRLEHGRVNHSEEPKISKELFYVNLRNWMYCLLNIDDYGNTPAYPTLEQSQYCFEHNPFVRINLKKSEGGGSIQDKTLDAHIDNPVFHALLLKQLSLYQDASIYLDCTRRRGISLLKELYPDLKPFYEEEVDAFIYYSVKKRIIVVNSYHPSYVWLNGHKQEYYSDMQCAIKEFFEAYPSFFNQ